MAGPEQQAREIIDSKLAASGWIVQTYRGMHLGAGRGIAITEFPGTNGPADYLVRETKGTRDFLTLRTSEEDKVNCGKKHFEAIGVPFAVVVTAEEV